MCPFVETEAKEVKGSALVKEEDQDDCKCKVFSKLDND